MDKIRELMIGELAAVLRCCNGKTIEGGGCANCPLKDYREAHEFPDCAEQAGLMAAQELMKLYNATEKLCEREVRALAELAKECNLALERGLHGVSDAKFAELTERQQLLAELGRASVVHAEPGGEHGWRIDWVTVEGAEVYRREGCEDE